MAMRVTTAQADQYGFRDTASTQASLARELAGVYERDKKKKARAMMRGGGASRDALAATRAIGDPAEAEAADHHIFAMNDPKYKRHNEPGTCVSWTRYLTPSHPFPCSFPACSLRGV